MENDIRVSFGLDAIQDQTFTLSDSLPEQIDPEKLELRYLVETEILSGQEKVKVQTGVIYMVDERPLCELILNTVFRLNPFSEIITIDNAKKTVSFTVEVIPTLLNIAFGTLRGVLFEKTKGTSLAAFPLPLIPMPQLVEMNRFKVRSVE